MMCASSWPQERVHVYFAAFRRTMLQVTWNGAITDINGRWANAAPKTMHVPFGRRTLQHE